MKPSTAKAKGRETENNFVRYMKDRWHKKVERRRQKGSKDEGDISGWDNVCVEVKSGSGKTVNINGWLRELAAEMEHSDSDFGFVAVRPQGKPQPEDGWYAVIPLEDLMQLYYDLEILLSDDSVI